MHLLATRTQTLADGSADGALWWVRRERDGLVVVVESPAGRSEFRGRDAVPAGAVGIGRCGSDLAGRWWSVTLTAAVTAFRLGDTPYGLDDVPLPAAHRGRRHLLHPAGDAVWWQAETPAGTLLGSRRYG